MTWAMHYLYHVALPGPTSALKEYWNPQFVLCLRTKASSTDHRTDQFQDFKTY